MDGPPTVPETKGECCHVMVVVISHKPAFLVSAQSTVVRASRQQIPAIQGRISRIRSPFTIDHPVYAALRLAYRLASSYNAWNRLCPCYGPWTLIPEIWYLKRDNAGRYAGSIAGATRVNFKEISKESRWEGLRETGLDWHTPPRAGPARQVTFPEFPAPLAVGRGGVSPRFSFLP